MHYLIAVGAGIVGGVVLYVAVHASLAKRVSALEAKVAALLVNLSKKV